MVCAVLSATVVPLTHRFLGRDLRSRPVTNRTLPQRINPCQTVGVTPTGRPASRVFLTSKAIRLPATRRRRTIPGRSIFPVARAARQRARRAGSNAAPPSRTGSSQISIVPVGGPATVQRTTLSARSSTTSRIRSPNHRRQQAWSPPRTADRRRICGDERLVGDLNGAHAQQLHISHRPGCRPVQLLPNRAHRQQLRPAARWASQVQSRRIQSRPACPIRRAATGSASRSLIASTIWPCERPSTPRPVSRPARSPAPRRNRRPPRDPGGRGPRNTIPSPLDVQTAAAGAAGHGRTHRPSRSGPAAPRPAHHR